MIKPTLAWKTELPDDAGQPKSTFRQKTVPLLPCAGIDGIEALDAWGSAADSPAATNPYDTVKHDYLILHF